MYDKIKLDENFRLISGAQKALEKNGKTFHLTKYTGTTMRTKKEIFNSNLEKNITFEYFSPDGYRVYSNKKDPNPYFRYKTKTSTEKLDTGYIKTTKNHKVIVKLYIENIDTIEKVKCPECKQDDYLKIQKSDGRNTKYVCKNKTCSTHCFQYLPQIQIKTLDNLIKSHFKISSIKGHKYAHAKYKKMHEEHKRITIEDEDIEYLEHYLLLGLSRDLIAELFSISTRTLRRFIKGEESLEIINKSRFKKEAPLDIGKKLIIHNIIWNANLFKSEIHYAYRDFTNEDYDSSKPLKYYIEKKSNKIPKK